MLRRRLPRFLIPIFSTLFAASGQTGAGESLDPAKISAISKMFLRDSAELPMDVAVTTVVTDAAGKVKRRSQSSVSFVFHGYSQQAGRFSFGARSGWFNTGALRDSEPGDFAVMGAFSHLVPDRGKDPELRVVPDPSGHGQIVKSKPPDCHDFEMQDRVLYPKRHCATADFLIGSDSAGAPVVERFGLEMANLPAQSKIAYLGEVQIRKYRAEGEVQKAYLPNDPAPFFVPKRVVTTISTDKGNIVLTNVYTLTANRAKKKWRSRWRAGISGRRCVAMISVGEY